ncbi:MAG: hypothetical protein HN759_12925 [Akkermansiaceae bacterium]|jgi:translation initiation factor IF-1|nr:hypothetical protein [Akkermansiaceae bacterium]
MFDSPISAIGTIISSPKPNIYRISLPNGKIAIGHVPKAQHNLHRSLVPEVQVIVELTAYDFEKARIVEVAGDNN